MFTSRVPFPRPNCGSVKTELSEHHAEPELEELLKQEHGRTSGLVRFRLFMKELFSQSSGPLLPQHPAWGSEEKLNLCFCWREAETWSGFWWTHIPLNTVQQPVGTGVFSVLRDDLVHSSSQTLLNLNKTNSFIHRNASKLMDHQEGTVRNLQLFY